MNHLEKLKSHPFVSDDVFLNIYEKPFKHIVIDNLFKPEIYEKISKKFLEYIARQKNPHGQVGKNPNNFYNAFIYGLKSEDFIEGFEFFIDIFWKDFLSEIFNTIYTQHTICSCHFHAGSIEKPSKDGWIHKDLSICSAMEDPSQIIKNMDDCEYADDSNQQIFSKKVIRSVANLFYLNNKKNPVEEDGGGTGVYASYKNKDIVKNILPINNRLFSFEISPLSYHAFIGAKFDRSAIVQWFHSVPPYYVYKHLDKFKEQWKKQNRIFDRWKDKDLWNLEQHPEYSNYFNKPIIEILNS